VAIKTFRGRLTLWYVAALASTLVLFAALLYAALSRALYRHHDAELASAASRLQRALEGVTLDEGSLGGALAALAADGALVMVRDRFGEVRYRSAVLQINEPNIGRHEALVHAAARGSSMPEFFTASLEQSGPVRFICVALPTTPTGYLQIGRSLGEVAPTLELFRDASLLVLPLVIVLTGYGGWWLATRALAPMEDIDRTLQRIHATDLSRRVSVTATDAELQHLATTVNQTLDRLEGAFATLRQFAADASHQLQTPLTVMKSWLDLAATRAAEANVQQFDEPAAAVSEMSAVLEDLQTLALADDVGSTQDEAVDLSAICQEALEIVTVLAEIADISVAAHIEPDVRVQGSAVKLRQVILNLADNAVKYTSAGGRVWLAVRRANSSAVLDVTDTGKGIEPQHVPRIFDRFYRGAERAGGGARGTGLGLAIAKRIVEVHRGSIAVSSEPGQGSTFTVTLPLLDGTSV
jgi:signal transduction histidine kinase